MLAGTCPRPNAGIFAARNQTRQAAGPVMPAVLARQQITILRLASSANRTVALLAAGSGHAARLFAAWSADGSGRWSLPPPLRPAARRRPQHRSAPAAPSPSSPQPTAAR